MTDTADSVLVVLSCQTCGATAHRSSPPPDWAEIRGFEDCVDWLDTAQLPQAGAHHRLHVRHPFRATHGVPFWVLYRPPRSALSGWDEHPEELSSSGIVECRLCADLGPDGRGQQIRIEVLQAVYLDMIPARFSPEDTASYAPLPAEPSGMSRDVLCWEGFTLRSWSAESNLGQWALYLSQHAKHVLILSGSWGVHDSTIFAGCRILTSSEADERSLR
ncbi:MAG: hypothetical protein P8R54_04040 [Myxococcota bacterium]|nr:hypothetical protein [Myxococcota bacterium]